MGTTRSTASLWRATGPDQRYPALATDAQVDVAVVGGGITGLTTALLLAEAGLQVAVLEARRLGNGTTGGTTGKVTSQHGMTYSSLLDDHGEDVARAYARAAEQAKEDVAGRAGGMDIDCEVRRLPAYIYARDDDEREQLQRELEAARELGLPATWDEDAGLPFETSGALRFDDQAQFHSIRYLHGLARRIEDLGGTVHEDSRVLDVTSTGGARVTTARGIVSADHVVLATLLPILDRGFEFARAFPSREYGLSVIVGEEPPAGMYITAGSPMRSLRPAAGGVGGNRLVIVGESHKTGHGDGTPEHLGTLEDFARRHFDVREVEFRWSAQDYTPADGLPYVGRLSLTEDNVHIATGLKKWGLTLGEVAARVISGDILGRRHELAGALDPGRLNLTASAGKLVEENLEVAKDFVVDRVKGWGSLEDIPPGEGGLVVVDGERLAVSKDENGQVTAVRPICTHLGCVVSWNGAERSWDCPCHGSRFTSDGEVIEGPAIAPLERRPL